MAAKRALIVDDSKSARLFLSRILVQHAIEVETVESAEEAIEYLADHRPDVIFMDHQMGGMDGLQAVKLIKNNPVTATIPIMMYTSQEGELYVGQARALGAVGVMPKQIKQTDVSKILYDLHLLPDRRRAEATGIQPVTLDTLAEAAVVAERAAPVLQSITESALREQFADLRRALVASIETQSDRVIADVHAALRDTPLFATTAANRQPPPDRGWVWAITAIALAIAFLSTVMWWREANLHQSLAAELAAARAKLEDRASELERPRTMTPASDASEAEHPVAASKIPGKPGASKPTIIPVPYGEAPLGGPRIEAIGQLFQRLIDQKFHGTVDIRAFPGRFCLIGNATDGYSLAPDELLYTRCETVGNPEFEGADVAQGESLALANLLGALRSGTKGQAIAKVSAGDPAMTLVPYPGASPSLTAGEWNRAATGNNRLEIRLR